MHHHEQCLGILLLLLFAFHRLFIGIHLLPVYFAERLLLLLWCWFFEREYLLLLVRGEWIVLLPFGWFLV